MLKMCKAGALLFLALLNGLGVLSKPAVIQKRSPSPVSLEGLTTNAKRFAAGLPPLSPARRWTRTGSKKTRW